MAKTREEFMDVMHNSEECYVYFTDENGCMRFVAEYKYKDGFCDCLADACLFDEYEAFKIKSVCNNLFPEHIFHIVKIRTYVEWC